MTRRRLVVGRWVAAALVALCLTAVAETAHLSLWAVGWIALLLVSHGTSTLYLVLLHRHDERAP